jgi:type IV secretory pathway TraG/TraD family ATPase VirD4
MKELKNTYQLWDVIVLFTFILTVITSYLLMKFTWHLGTDWGYFEEHIEVWKTILSEVTSLETYSYYQYKYYLSKNNFLIDFMLHISLPLFLGFIASFISVMQLFLIKGGRDKAIHISGSRLLKNKFAIKHAKKALKKELRNNASTGLNLHPQIVVSEIQEAGNILITGAQGAGKSTVIKPIVKAISNTEGLMLIYDAKREYTPLFYQKGHLLLSPTDKRSLYWDIASDVTSTEIAYEISACFIVQSNKDPIWANGARLILTGCMISLNNIKPKWSWDDLKNTLDKSVSELSQLFDNYYPKASKLLSENSKTTDSFFMELTTQLYWLDSVAKIWTNNSKHRFSISRWVNGKYNTKSLIIANDPKYSSISSPLCSAVLSIVVREVLSLPDNNSVKYWFVLDELADLPKTESLVKWLSLGRAKGARTIAGTQNISQIQAIYGDKETETLTSLFSNIITLKVGSSAETAKKVADNLGKRLVKRATINFDKEGNKSTSYQQSEEYIVRPEQLMHLPSPNKQGITGYLSISGWNAVYELVWPYPNLEIIAEAHIPVQLDSPPDNFTNNSCKRGSRGRNRSC